MTDRRRQLICWMLILAPLSGCAHRGGCPPIVQSSGPSLVTAAAWETSERGVLPAISSSIPAYDETLDTIPSRLVEGEYRALEATEAQCRAAEFAPLAHLLLSENDANAASGMCDTDGQCAEPLKSELQEMRAIDERNKAAANSLRVFYRLAEAETGNRALERSLDVLAGAISDARKVRELGITLAVDESALERQRIDLLNEREQVQLAILQLNQQLAQLLGVDRPEAIRFWPQVDWSVTAASLSEGMMISQGLNQRADLAMLRRTQQDLNSNTVSAARQVLALGGVGLGQVSPISFVLLRKKRCACAACEQRVRSLQLEQLAAHQEERAVSEIRQAVYAVETRVRQAALAADNLKSWRRRLDDVRTLWRNDQATQFEVYTAEIETISAETNLLRQIIELRIAEVELKAAQGMLSAECGYSIASYY